MLEQELRDIWKSSAKAEQIKFDLSRLMMDLDSKMKSQERAIRRRDRREIAVAVLMIPFYAFLTYEVPFIWSKIGTASIMIWCVYVIYKLKSVQKAKADPSVTTTFREQLDDQKTHMVQQANLLETVFYWYILPPFIGNLIFVLGLGDPVGTHWADASIAEFLPISLGLKIAYLVASAFVSVLIYILNKIAAKKNCYPIIDEIENVQGQMENDLE